ncbi:MAG: alcohol dehydrogenase catalytic domain-containing protein [Acidobacteria bacterium]|nr:alcohol dehydrogenase catalytic domain-containing protein [Acidobacteriota bacterium]
MTIPETMKLGLYFSNEDVQVEQRPVPEIGQNEVLVEVAACGICGSDTMRWYREPGTREKGGINTGHEIAGRIVQAGESVRNFITGDRVVVSHHFPCLQCVPCQDGNETACEQMQRKHIEPGGFSQYVRLFDPCIEKGLFALPDSMTFEQGSFVEPLACVVRGVRKTAPIDSRTVLVLGSGLAGLLHIKLARALGAGRIYAVDTNQKRLEAASQNGADEMIHAADQLPRADRVFVCTGSQKAAESALDCVNRGGHILFFAADGPDKKLLIPLTKFWTTQPSLSFSYGAAPRDMKEAMELIRSGKVAVDGLVTHRFGIDQIAQAFDLVANPRDNSLKVIIEPNRR